MNRMRKAHPGQRYAQLWESAWNHPKIRRAGRLDPMAGFLWYQGLGYCVTTRSDGVIPKDQVAGLCHIHYQRLPYVIKILLDLRLWEVGVDSEGNEIYLIHDWLTHQFTVEEMNVKYGNARKHGKAGGLAKAAADADQRPTNNRPRQDQGGGQQATNDRPSLDLAPRVEIANTAETLNTVLPDGIPDGVPSKRESKRESESERKSEEQDTDTGKPSPPNNNINTQSAHSVSISPSTNGVLSHPLFLRVFNLYPSKTSRDLAARAWQTLNPDPATVEMMIRTLTWQIADGEYLPGCFHLWLQDRRWEDIRKPPKLSFREREAARARVQADEEWRRSG